MIILRYCILVKTLSHLEGIDEILPTESEPVNDWKTKENNRCKNAKRVTYNYTVNENVLLM